MSWNEDRSVDQLICWYDDQSIMLIWGPVSWHVSWYVEMTVSWYVDMRTDQLIWGPVKNVDMRTSQLICWYEDRSVEVETILHHFNPISESWPAEPLWANELSFTHYQPAARGLHKILLCVNFLPAQTLLYWVKKCTQSANKTAWSKLVEIYICSFSKVRKKWKN